METYGIKETTDLLKFVSGLVEAGKASFEDGKVNLVDLANFVLPLTLLPAAIEGVNQVPAELGDLSDEEIQALVNEVGDIVSDERFGRAFEGAAILADALYEIITGKQ
jgi:hypothetical protein